MDPVARKKSLRAAMVGRILETTPEERRRQDEFVNGRLASLPGFDAADTVLLYVSAFPEEVVTSPALRLVLSSGKRLVCPRVDRKAGRLRLFEVKDLGADLVPGTLGIPEPGRHLAAVEPEAIDWVLVPGLAFDDRGYRLGRGAGHYDRLLPTLRPDVPRWAFAYDCQWVDSLPVEPHDQPLDGILSAGREWRVERGADGRAEGP